MSSVLAPTTSLTPETPLVVPPPTEYERFVDQRLNQTRRRVQGVDLAVALVLLAIGVLGYLLAAAVVDHWLVTGGLGFGGRFLFWLGLIGGLCAYGVRCLLPPLAHRINPLFAADTIEKSQSTLKNSLINFLLLRDRRQDVAVPVYRAMEYRAAADLSNVRVEVAVDQTRLVRAGCVLAAVLAALTIYLVVSPKNPIRSAARVMWPWASIEAATRVTIHDVQPGDAAAFQGEFVAVSAEIVGLRQGETPEVVFSSADGQIVDQTMPLSRVGEGYRYQCRFPPGSLGLQQDFEYHLTAGDCHTPTYHLTAQIAPAIDIDAVTYHYPAYTGLPDRKVQGQGQGDLKAIEGTEVSLHATANTEIKPNSAEIDLGCTGRRSVRMTAEGRSAVGRPFTLRLNPDDASRAEYDSYLLRFSDLQGHENLHPVRYTIEVIRDQPPEVQLVEPQSRTIDVAEDGRLPIKVRAVDPDFALRRVTLQAECNGQSLPIAPLLDLRGDEKPWQGEFRATYVFEPRCLGLKAGDRVQYWAEAEDNKEPAANRSATDKQWITVVAPEHPREQQPANKAEDKQQGEKQQGEKQQGEKQQGEKQQGEKQQGEKQQGEKQQGEKQQGEKQEGEKQQGEKQQGEKQQGEKQPGEKQQGEKQQGEKQQGEKQQGEKQPGGGQSSPDRPSENPNERIDGEANPGDAIQKILDDRRKEGEKPHASPNKDSKGEADQKKPEDKPGEGAADEKKPQNKPGEGAVDEKKPQNKPGEDAADEKKPQDKPGEGAADEKKPQNKPGEDAADEKKPQGKPGEGAADEKKPQNKPGEGAADEKKPQNKPGEGAADEKKPQNKPGEGAADEKKPQNKPGEGAADEKKPQDKPGEDAADEKKPQGKPGEGAADEKKPQNKPGEGAADEKKPQNKPGEGAADEKKPQDKPGEGAADEKQSKKPSGERDEQRLITGNGAKSSNNKGDWKSPSDGADAVNLDYARRQTELALEHLRDQLAKEKPRLLDQLGWTKNDARRFLDRWIEMKRAASEAGAKGEAARKQFNEALRSLGLRPRGVELRGGEATDQRGSLHDAGRHDPPPEWADQFHAYTRGVAGERQKADERK